MNPLSLESIPLSFVCVVIVDVAIEGNVNLHALSLLNSNIRHHDKKNDNTIQICKKTSMKIFNVNNTIHIKKTR